MSILDQIANPTPLKLDDPMEKYSQYLQNALVMDKMGEMRREREATNVMREGTRRNTKNGMLNRAGYKQYLADNNAGENIFKADKEFGEQDKTVAETGNAEAQRIKHTLEARGKLLDINRSLFDGLPPDPKLAVPQLVTGLKNMYASDDMVTLLGGPEGVKRQFEAELKGISDALQSGPQAWENFKIQKGVGLKEALAHNMKMLEEYGRNNRNAADNQTSTANSVRSTNASIGNNIRTNQTSTANNIRTNQTSAANNAATNATSTANNIRGIASRAELQKRGFDEARWRNDVKYADEMMERGGLVSQILKKEFPWITVGTIGRRPVSEQITLWERSGRNPFMAARPGTSLHGLGAAIDYGHGKVVPRDEIVRFHNRARELGIEMYDETTSKNGAHQHGTIVNPPDIATLRQILNGGATQRLVTDENYTRVPDAPGVKVPRHTGSVPDFRNRAVMEFNRKYKDSGFYINGVPGTSAQKAMEIERLRRLHENQWRLGKGEDVEPMLDDHEDGGISAEDLARAYDFLQQERLRNSQINRNNARAGK